MAPSASTENRNMPPPPRPLLQSTTSDSRREPSSSSFARTTSRSIAQILFQPKELAVQLDHLHGANHSAIAGAPSAFQLKLKDFDSSPAMPPYNGSSPTSSPDPSRRAVPMSHERNNHSLAYDAYLAKTYGTPIDSPATAEPGADPSTTHKEQVLSYIYSWIEWTSRIEDPDRRAQVITFLKDALEGALKHGIEIRAFLPEDIHGIKGGVSGQVKIEISVQASASAVDQGETVSAVPSAEDIVAVQKAALNSINGTKRDTTDAGIEENAEKPELKKQKHVPDMLQVVKAGDPDHKAMKASTQRKPVEGDAAQTQEPDVNMANGQQQTSPEVDPESAESGGEELSPEENAKRDRYLQEIFRPRFNIVMKMAGRALARGKCSDWHTCRKRLEDANVDAKHRNIFMHDFIDGYKKWNEAAKGDPNLEIAEYLKERHAKLHQRAAAADGLTLKQGSKVTSAQLAVVPTPAVRSRVTTNDTGRRVLSIRTSPGFDPVDYTAYAVFEYRNFIFEYTCESTVKERLWLSDQLRHQVDTTLVRKGWYHFMARQVEVKNEQGKIIVVGMFVERKPDIIYGDEDLRRPDEVAPLLFLKQFSTAAHSAEEDGDDLEDPDSPPKGDYFEDLNDDYFDATEDAIDGE